MTSRARHRSTGMVVRIRSASTAISVTNGGSAGAEQRERAGAGREVDERTARARDTVEKECVLRICAEAHSGGVVV